jgi:hypothetical protein
MASLLGKRSFWANEFLEQSSHLLWGSFKCGVIQERAGKM